MQSRDQKYILDHISGLELYNCKKSIQCIKEVYTFEAVYHGKKDVHKNFDRKIKTRKLIIVEREKLDEKRTKSQIKCAKLEGL